ncbi:MAG: ABC transporter ATP-binding protein [Alphaproteobacteria bacterium]|nr:MAG: ABC transporter ATP-binding protein [Alphaproteobacteria bacterium]
MNNIELISVTKDYGRTKAVDNIDFGVAPGECLALVGHNGAGKSTLIKMVLGLTRPTKGRVTVMGHDPMATSFNRVRKTIGFLPEQVLFQNNMTGRETLDFYARLKGASVDGLDDLFCRVDLLSSADDRIATYSKGMRQRLGLAQALIGSPELLILDEPTSGLDPASRQNVYGIINDMKSAGTTILISSHALTELDSRIDRVAVLSRGKLVALGTIAELRQNIGLPSEIKIQAPAESLKILTRHFGGKCLINGAARFSCPAGGKIAILKELMDLNIPLADIEMNDPSLEQVFLALTHKERQADE